MTESRALAPLKTRWTDRFALDLAMTLEGSGESDKDLLKSYNFSPLDLQVFSQDPLFIQRVEHYRVQLKEHGLSFKLKARAQAELLLDTSWDVIHTEDVSAAVKADLIKWTAKMAGYEPAKGPETGGDGGVKINIFMGDPTDAPPPGIRTIEHE